MGRYARDIRRLAVGQVGHRRTARTGGAIDDATVFRLGHDGFRFIGEDEYDGVWLRELVQRVSLKVWVKPSTDQLHNLAVQGPESRGIAEAARLDSADPSVARGAQVVRPRRPDQHGRPCAPIVVAFRLSPASIS